MVSFFVLKFEILIFFLDWVFFYEIVWVDVWFSNLEEWEVKESYVLDMLFGLKMIVREEVIIFLIVKIC